MIRVQGLIKEPNKTFFVKKNQKINQIILIVNNLQNLNNAKLPFWSVLIFRLFARHAELQTDVRYECFTVSFIFPFDFDDECFFEKFGRG